MLTDMHCRTAKPRELLYRLNDRDGLYLEVKPNGVKAFRYRFKLGGKESMMALGEYPATALSEAREKAQAARKLVKDGINPVHKKQLDKARQELDRSNTLELIAAEWLATKDWEDVTKMRRLDMLRRVVFPTLGKLPVRDITAHQVLAILQATHTRAPSVAAEAKRTLSAIFQFAVATLRADLDPVWPVRNALPKNKTQHKTALTKEQVGKLLTDNGKEFTDRLFASKEREPSGRHEFDQLCQDLGIEHRLTRPRTPRTNGMVERFNGRIADVLKTHRFNSREDMQQTLQRYVTLYNHQLPQSALKSKTPMQAMKEWYQTQTHLFHRRPYDRPGCDTYRC